MKVNKCEFAYHLRDSLPVLKGQGYCFYGNAIAVDLYDMLVRTLKKYAIHVNTVDNNENGAYYVENVIDIPFYFNDNQGNRYQLVINQLKEVE